MSNPVGLLPCLKKFNTASLPPGAANHAKAVTGSSWNDTVHLPDPPSETESPKDTGDRTTKNPGGDLLNDAAYALPSSQIFDLSDKYVANWVLTSSWHPSRPWPNLARHAGKSVIMDSVEDMMETTEAMSVSKSMLEEADRCEDREVREGDAAGHARHAADAGAEHAGGAAAERASDARTEHAGGAGAENAGDGAGHVGELTESKE